MMDRINKIYTELLESGERPDTAVMNYNTYRKLIKDMGGSKFFICPPEIYLSSGTLLTIEIDDKMEDEEIIVCERCKLR